MNAETLPSLPELEETLGSGASAKGSRRWWIFGGLAMVVVVAPMLAFSWGRGKNQAHFESAPVMRGDVRVTVHSTALSCIGGIADIILGLLVSYLDA